jgi:hypothetical protein
MPYFGHKESAWFFYWSLIVAGLFVVITYRKDPVSMSAGAAASFIGIVMLLLPPLLRGGWPLVRFAGLTVAAISAVAGSVALFQAHSVILAPSLGVVTLLFAAGYLMTGQRLLHIAAKVKREARARHPVLNLLVVISCGAILGGALAWGWWVSAAELKKRLELSKSQPAMPVAPSKSEASTSSSGASSDEILSRLTTVLHKQPHFRFVLKLARFGTETCDALELWNDGEPIELQSIRQASYIELSFPQEVSSPEDDANFASRLEARYGIPHAQEAFSSVPEETINLNYLQEFMRHPSNPMHFPNNTQYVLSLQDEFDVKYVVGAWDLVMTQMKPLGITTRATPAAATEAQIETPHEDAPAYLYVRYIPTYYFIGATMRNRGNPEGWLLFMHGKMVTQARTIRANSHG